jgi:hypothetical protein
MEESGPRQQAAAGERTRVIVRQDQREHAARTASLACKAFRLVDSSTHP